MKKKQQETPITVNSKDSASEISLVTMVNTGKLICHLLHHQYIEAMHMLTILHASVIAGEVQGTTPVDDLSYYGKNGGILPLNTFSLSLFSTIFIEHNKLLIINMMDCHSCYSMIVIDHFLLLYVLNIFLPYDLDLVIHAFLFFKLMWKIFYNVQLRTCFPFAITS